MEVEVEPVMYELNVWGKIGVGKIHWGNNELTGVIVDQRIHTYTHTQEFSHRTTNSMGNGVHFLAMVTFGCGIFNT